MNVQPAVVFSTHVPASQHSFTSVLLQDVVHLPPSQRTPLVPHETSSHVIDASPADTFTPPLQLAPVLQ